MIGSDKPEVMEGYNKFATLLFHLKKWRDEKFVKFFYIHHFFIFSYERLILKRKSVSKR